MKKLIQTPIYSTVQFSSVTQSCPTLHGLVIKWHPSWASFPPGLLLFHGDGSVYTYRVWGLKLERLSWVNRWRAQHQLKSSSLNTGGHSQRCSLFQLRDIQHLSKNTATHTLLSFPLKGYSYCESSNLYLFFKVVWAILGPLHFHIHFEPLFCTLTNILLWFWLWLNWIYRSVWRELTFKHIQSFLSLF